MHKMALGDHGQLADPELYPTRGGELPGEDDQLWDEQQQITNLLSRPDAEDDNDIQAAARTGARFDDFIIYNQLGTRDQLNLIARGLLHWVRARILRHQDRHARQP